MNKDNKNEISHNLLIEWRKLGILSNEEIAYQMGDLFVAENVVSRDRRVINVSSIERSKEKRILKG
jgi:hypothetical protein